ncbi:hypothetical protein [Aneurinibacillus aneurinilyticus]|uniref:Uncharacterized protein n=1 Tax=Aneurinibacillus aneurinilyticus TaxID=1391 RepID=A0A848D2A6_ANEAE|nr:hypothetical protein [Aneurinibacillus aneurinilyticus]MED0671618.1 hypothetical protein [Aneurinibacillus aneurinilyticus]MED0706910.1 hypothetical protein [Aneurinibacillus aneurinilyticus]MED0723413.1 hypothetical protein [Aneurinibacillus aneurinilyticus]MED0733452.1 hypothetical protein [Aneurinibacillus aneurinilyticus]MED0740202.1 hypothetical protein [Aneurinibacillus aneurinilyticus]
MHTALELIFPVIYIGEEKSQAIVLGVDSSHTKKGANLRRTFSEYGIPILVMPIKEAETVRTFYKNYLSTRFFNEELLYEECKHRKADYIIVRRALGLEPGIGQKRSEISEKEALKWLKQAIFFSTSLEEKLGRTLKKDVMFGIWEDAKTKLTEYVIEELNKRNYGFRIFTKNRETVYPLQKNIVLCEDKWEAVEEVSGLFILSPGLPVSQIPIKEWARQMVRMSHATLIDPYGLYEPEEIESIGYHYISYGRCY